LCYPLLFELNHIYVLVLFLYSIFLSFICLFNTLWSCHRVYEFPAHRVNALWCGKVFTSVLRLVSATSLVVGTC